MNGAGVCASMYESLLGRAIAAVRALFYILNILLTVGFILNRL